jgi:transcriptional regulator with XRE-family HTH domain
MRNEFHGRLPIGEALQEARVCQSVSRRELERKSGMSGGYLSRVENGELIPGFDRLDAICAVLNIAPWRLIRAACRMKELRNQSRPSKLKFSIRIEEA